MIRDVQPGDRSVFLSMARDFYASDAVAHNVEERALETVFDDAAGGSPYIRALIIEHDAQPAGFALLAISYATEAGGLSVQLEDLYIRDSFRGHGLGSEFMRYMEREYPRAKRFRLEVTPGNQGAIALYRRLGYVTLSYVQMVKDK